MKSPKTLEKIKSLIQNNKSIQKEKEKEAVEMEMAMASVEEASQQNECSPALYDEFLNCNSYVYQMNDC